jgi:hypothetical protein
MTIELRVPGRRQLSQMSCWWACMAMILEYYGRSYHFPWQFRAEFRRPFGRYGTADLVYPSLDDALRYDEELAWEPAPHLAPYLQPYEWYERGLPAVRAAFERLHVITGFRGFDVRPAFGAWRAADVESRLRSHGPFVFFGSWNGFPHAILTVGLLGRTDEDAVVVTIDPIRGHATNESLHAFNSRMVSNMRDYNFDSLNPMYLPQAEPLRAVVIDEPGPGAAATGPHR